MRVPPRYSEQVNCRDWDAGADRTSPRALAAQASALTYTIDNARLRSPADKDIQSLHSRLFSWCVPVNYYAGNYRSTWKPCLNVNVAVGPIMGTPPGQVKDEMAKLVHDIARDVVAFDARQDEIDDDETWGRAFATLVADSVGRFIKIHPFRDGNGRTSRLLWAWFMERYDLPLNVRVLIRPDPPYGDAMAACMRGDHSAFADYVLDELDKALAEPSE